MRPAVIRARRKILFISQSERQPPVGVYAREPVTRPANTHAQYLFDNSLPSTATQGCLSYSRKRVENDSPGADPKKAAVDSSTACCSFEVVTITSPITLAPNDVKGFFTCLPAYFSAFVHTTCSLSDLVQYLAFDQVHDRISTALSNCTTLGNLSHFLNWRHSCARPDGYGTIALLGGTFQCASSGCPSCVDKSLALQFRSFRILPLQIQA